MNTLHPTKTLQALQPQYASRFACIGPACEDNCCTGWTVHVDKKTFNAYRQSTKPALAERLKSQVKRVRSQASDAVYARVEMNPQTQACPFLEEKLCGIHAGLGEDKLSDTCATYPRSTRLMGGQHEQALALSCPEAARLALLAADGLDFIEAPVTVRPSVVKEVKAKTGLSPDAMGSVRVFALQLVKTDGLALWQKLAVLGLFCEQLTQLLKTSGHARVPALIQEMVELAASGAADKALSVLLPDHAVQASIFSKLWQFKIRKKLSPVQEAVQKAVARGLGADAQTHEVTDAQLIERYRSGVVLLPDAMKEVPFLLENYLLNEMFSEKFPFGEFSPYDHFLKLITRFGLVRLMLAAQCNDEEALPDGPQMARTVQVFCRQYQHDNNFALMVNGALKVAGWDSLEKIYRFLRT